MLNAVYLRKMASPEHVAHATGLDPVRVRAALAESASKGLTVDLGGQYMLSEDGRHGVLAHYADACAPLRENRTVVEWYERFETTTNAQFIKLVTEWQKSDGDERVQDRLVRLVERHIGGVRELAKSIPRYESYAARFEQGLSHIDAGERDFVCKPTIDSVHNVWFEFHEDILAAIGRPRET